MMKSPASYKTSQSFWRAVTEHAKTATKSDERTVTAFLGQFVHERFLARIFSGTGNWVLKGGNAVLARVSDARTTQDVDLLRQLVDLDVAYNELIAAAKVDLEDHFRFEPVKKTTAGHGGDQPAVEGVRVVFDAYCGSRKVQSVKVDLVVGSIMTADPEESSKPVLEIEGLESPKMLLYPIVDHIADKLCATQARYGSANNRSSRVRDLVDLVVFARTQDIYLAPLSVAISSEWAVRKLEGSPSFDPPLDWQGQYSSVARDVPACGEFTTFESARALTTKLLEPACRAETAEHRWDCNTLQWVAVSDS
ncbi:nucleotidyl transferase AbiEii/AbiGii toxin family protein [Arthrobacter sp. StoSoilB22]|uniref:nucleotidyl transferase AbiEii/AbiGii toxin family protein n=1 Tax=Arthrobacter sp. StoSoilB22 TaxID=2830996 RepID=UPI001CC78443|nr:nucleotidyl transferase AbiEii/AbiGii toxin family protein [Arthrobacter sp. StoSoilB22]BCW64760.1 hypothetical protein StoSoilB22_37330 [Arthrobacter sp. StoSoilB22]